MTYIPATNTPYDLGPAGDPYDDPREAAAEHRENVETAAWMGRMARLDQRGMLHTAPLVEQVAYLHNINLP